MSLGTELKNVREANHLTRQNVAEMLNIPYTTLSNYENDTREPNSDFLRKFATMFDVTIDSLFGINPKYVSKEEFQLIKKYRKLDTHGKETIDILLNHELQRCEGELENRMPAETR